MTQASSICNGGWPDCWARADRMRLAFYAPLKSPNHSVPSGDRAMARALMAALGEFATVDLVSDLRTRDGLGDPLAQMALAEAASGEILRLAAQGGWDAFVTYHNYYKAPDLIGNAVARYLKIPYVIIEASRAAKRLTGPWAAFARMAEEASNDAQAHFCFTGRDWPALEAAIKPSQKLVRLPPFLDRADLPPLAQGTGGRILTVGMMRPGDKVESYRILSEALAGVSRDWTLDIIGDGPARGAVEALFAQFGDRVRFLGQQDAQAVSGAMQRADLFVWPGVNEAFGLVYLEARAHGLPVVAQDRPGVRDVAAVGGQLTAVNIVNEMTTAIGQLLSDRTAARQLGQAGRADIAAHHLRGPATATLQDVLKDLIP